jgi:hypothetical protein
MPTNNVSHVVIGLEVQETGTYLVNYRILLVAQASSEILTCGVYDIDTDSGPMDLEVTQTLSTTEQMNISATGIVSYTSGQTIAVGVSTPSAFSLEFVSPGTCITLSITKIDT